MRQRVARLLETWGFRYDQPSDPQVIILPESIIINPESTFPLQYLSKMNMSGFGGPIFVQEVDEDQQTATISKWMEC